MELENLVAQLSRNPNAIVAIEKEIQQLVVSPTLSPLYELQQSTNPAVRIYLCKILELRCKGKTMAPETMSEEIAFVMQLLQHIQTYHVCNLYSILGLYCWPTHFPSFLNDLASLLSVRTGYEILLLFLQKVNSSTDIDEKRRTELKTAIRIVSKDLMMGFKEEYEISYIIQIYTEFLKMIPMNYDYSLVFRKASDYPNEAIEFFSEAGTLIDQNKVVNVLDQLPVNSTMIYYVMNHKIKDFSQPEKIYEYVFRCLVEDSECFIPAVDFWQKIFSTNGKAGILEPVLIEITKAYLTIDEDAKEDTDGFVHGFFSIVAKNYPEESVKFLKKHESVIPARIISNFLNKIAKSGDYLSTVKFQDNYLNCLTSFLQDDPNTPLMVRTLDFTNRDSVKLAIQIIGKYKFTQEELLAILHTCDNCCISANELKAKCLISLGIHDSFDGDWTMDKVIRYYYFLKNDKANYVKYKDSFLSLFIQNAPFDRCFAIVESLGNVPNFILQNIYEKMDKYSYVDLCCFNIDFLNDLSPEIQKPFMEKEVVRFIAEWNTIENYKDYYKAIKSLLNVFNPKLEVPGVVDMMLDLIQVDYVVTINKILSMFNTYKGTYNTRKAVYYFITSYNSPNLNDSQAQLAASLTFCMYQPDGPQAFSEVLGLEITKCVDVRNQITKTNRKSAQNIVRNLIKDFRGKPLRSLYENDVKVTKQNFLKPKPVMEED